MQVRSPVGTDVQDVFHEDLAKVADRVRRQLVPELEYLLPTAGPTAVESAELVRAAPTAREEILLAGAAGLDKLARDLHAALTPHEAFGVEAVVLLEGRPAIPVLAGGFSEPPAEWSVLTDARAAIRDSIAGVGRIEVSGHPGVDWVGTGFLAGPGLVMTNRHIAAEFATRGPAGWTFGSGLVPHLNLTHELGSQDRLELAVTDVAGVHQDADIDLALLRVEATTPEALPPPLPVAVRPPEDQTGRAVYLIGHPAWDGRRSEPDVLWQLFAGVGGVKRLLPGVTQGLSESTAQLLRHDASPLGHYPGSPVIDLVSHTVLGLHVGARYGVGGFAVPLWRLADDPLVAGINFTDRGSDG